MPSWSRCLNYVWTENYGISWIYPRLHPTHKIIRPNHLTNAYLDPQKDVNDSRTVGIKSIAHDVETCLMGLMTTMSLQANDGSMYDEITCSKESRSIPYLDNLMKVHRQTFHFARVWLSPSMTSTSSNNNSGTSDEPALVIHIQDNAQYLQEA